jgi:hypothetical protein
MLDGVRTDAPCQSPKIKCKHGSKSQGNGLAPIIEVGMPSKMASKPPFSAANPQVVRFYQGILVRVIAVEQIHSSARLFSSSNLNKL